MLQSMGFWNVFGIEAYLSSVVGRRNVRQYDQAARRLWHVEVYRCWEAVDCCATEHRELSAVISFSTALLTFTIILNSIVITAVVGTGTVGARDGAATGTFVGSRLGTAVGDDVGLRDGLDDGDDVGTTE
jgi:hypothetical protein